MPIPNQRVLQIVPYAPGSLDGVGDNALVLAQRLLADHNLWTRFAVSHQTNVTAKDGFEVISGLDESAVDSLARDFDHVILHYVNYGYQSRGVPFHLRRFARRLRGKLRGRWLTAFHELYASGPPWSSAFWLRPLQVKIARDLIGLSDGCFVSNRTIEEEIRAYDPVKKIYPGPIVSNFGEPEITDFSAASPKNWAICGGTALVAQSLSSFRRLRDAIPPAFAPAQLHVIGGRNETATRELVGDLAGGSSGLSCHYHPEVSAERASELVGQCSFAWLDYFGSGRVWPGMILKSSAFAACCAHGLVPVVSHREDAFALAGDPFPGPFFMTRGLVQFPPLEELRTTREKIYAWYHAHASARRLAQTYAEALA
jgi:hypothetical protein